MRLTVLAVAGGGFQGESLADTIRAVPQARVVVLDTISDNLGRTFADAYLVSPPIAQQERFSTFLEAVIREEQVDIVLPCSNIVLKPLASLRKRVEAAGARLGVCDSALLDILLDKRRCYEALLEAGIPAQQPVLLSPTSVLPLCGKPRDGWGGRDMIVVHARQELEGLDHEQLRRTHCWVPYLDTFEEFSVDLAINFQAEVSPLTVRKRVRTSSGFSVISDSVDHEGVKAIASDVARWMAQQGGCGLFNLQILLAGDGAFYVSDINPRHGTSSCHARAEGNNLVGFLAGAHVSASRTSVRTVRSLQQKSMPLPGSGRWKGVVFDLDDTLIDHKRWMMDKVRLASAPLSSLVEQRRLLRVAYAAIEEGPHDRLIDIIAERLGMPSLRDTLLQAYRDATPARAEVFPEVPDVLTVLRRSGMRLALLTDNPPESQRAKLQAMPDLRELFDAVIFTRELGNEKPDAVGFLEAAKRLGLSPSSLLMVGDNPGRDALGAIDAGYGACMLVSRPGTRFHINEMLLRQIAPEVASHTWVNQDLRALPFVCGAQG